MAWQPEDDGQLRGFTAAGGGFVRPSIPGEGSAGFMKPARRRRFPASQSEFAARFPKLADHLTLLAAYSCQDAPAGAPPSIIRDSAAGKDLTENQALLYRVQADPLGRICVELDTSDANEFASNADAAFADLPNNADRTLLLRFSIGDNDVVGRALGGAGSSAALARWGLLLTATSGKLSARASDATTTVNAITASAYDDAAFHDAAAVWNRTAGTPALRVITEGEIASTNLGALSAVDAATGLRLGAAMGLQAQAGCRISAFYLLAGAMTQADMALWRTPL